MDSFYPQSGDWNTVSAAFHAHTVAERSLLAKVAGIPSEGRKAERVAELCRALEGESLRDLLARLSPSQRSAVAMAVHSWDGRFSSEGFRICFGEEPDFGKQSRTWSGLDEPSLLCFFIHGDRIPRDLRFRLRALVPPPECPPIPRLDAPPGLVEVTVPPYRATSPSDKAETLRMEVCTIERSQEAPAELIEVLRLVEARALERTGNGNLTAASGKAVRRVLVGGEDFLDPLPKPRIGRGYEHRIDFGAIRAFAWPQLLLAGELARARGRHLVLGPQGAEVIRDPSASSLQHLWSAWLERGVPDELHRITGLGASHWKKAELTPPSARRKAIARALSDCPAGALGLDRRVPGSPSDLGTRFRGERSISGAATDRPIRLSPTRPCRLGPGRAVDDAPGTDSALSVVRDRGHPGAHPMSLTACRFTREKTPRIRMALWK